jgi:hypothetical protein
MSVIYYYIMQIMELKLKSIEVKLDRHSEEIRIVHKHDSDRIMFGKKQNNIVTNMGLNKRQEEKNWKMIDKEIEYLKSKQVLIRLERATLKYYLYGKYKS